MAFELGLQLGELAPTVVACRAREGMSRTACVDVEVMSPMPLALDGAYGQEATVVLGARSWTLVLGGASYLGHHHGAHRHLLTLHDPLWLLGHKHDTRKFRKLSAQQIVDAVLEEHGVVRRWELSDELPVRKYCVQYHESDLDFVERLLAFEGIHYRMEDGTLVLADDSRLAPRVPDDRPYALIEGGDALQSGVAGLHRLRRSASMRSGSVTLGDYNWKQPHVLLRETALADRDGELNHYVYPGAFRQPAQGQRLAAMRLEEVRSKSALLEGQGTVFDFVAGQAFSVGAEAGDAFAGDWLLVELEHQHAGDAEAIALVGDLGQTHLWAMPLTKRFRPPQKQRPDVGGSHTVMVRGPAGEEIHTDAFGRFRGQMHWDRAAVGSDEDSRWMRKVQEVATSQGLARVGWEMYVGYIDGDPERPIGVGRAINGVMPPEYALPGAKNVMSIKTPSSPASGGYNEIKMDDSGGAQGIAMRAEKDLNALVKNNKTELIGNNEAHAIKNDFARQVSGDQALTIGGNASETIGHNEALIVEGDRKEIIGLNSKLEVVEGFEDRIAVDESEKVGSLRFTLAGSFTPPDLGKLAKSAAMSFVSAASPGAVALKSRFASYQTKLKNPGAALAGAVTPSKLKSGALGVLSQGAQAGAQAALDGKGLGAAAGAAGDALESGAEGLGASLGAGLSGVFPTQAQFQGELDAIQGDLDSIIPTQDTLSKGLTGGADVLTGGLYSSLKGKNYSQALDQAIDMFFVGSITRAAEKQIFKLVGGAFITVAVPAIRWDAGFGYLETVGGVKLTAVLGHIETTSDGILVTTVGGAAIRSSLGETGIHTVTSSINVGGMMGIFGGERVEIRGATVKLSADVALLVSAGGASILMTPSAIEISGNVALEGGTAVKTAGEVFITK